ncbi:type II toxin-antitoxin system death-on-curing family toxin [Mycobacterium sp. TY815]|uniref:type II toxin-antitoxin system death-on-curing family toxin n=1 Tax=Mycobacterium sp. TY815 TaxID=3050581 RepID=UPI0027411856|nr:type II toxin-antitoxin system death-on-curing family toxin [Mycobacterium sp. TY815]MDP7703350.1 type II toxin-antitoxin system death-on-curing family toxin [Mycobacterium sp. TY815]
MTTYLSITDVLDINQKFVGPGQLRDYGLLDAAVMRPQSSAFGADAFPSLHDKAAALLHGLACYHPFVDGNKRTSWSATATFYDLHRYVLPVRSDDVVRLMLDAAEGRCDVEDIAAILKSWAQPVPVNDDWMDSAPERARLRRTDENQITELTHDMLQEIDGLLIAHGLDHDLRASAKELWKAIDTTAETVAQSIESGLPLQEESLQSLRRMRHNLLTIHPDMPPEWADQVNAHPLFIMLDALEMQPRLRKSPGRSKKQPKRRRR